MSGNPNLLSLPEEVIRYIGTFLNFPDLLALSATCQRLRSALNCNSVWRKYSEGGAVSKALEGLPSIVRPTFINPENFNSTLQPLCEHRLHFLRQTRLINNFCNGKFVKSAVTFPYCLSDLGICHFLFSDRQITYKDRYLFALGYYESFEVVRVYDITECPCLLVKFKLIKHENHPSYSVVVCLKVVGNKLVVRQDNRFDVYEIRLPNLEFPLLHSIDVRTSPSDDDNSLLLVRDFIIVENYSSFSSNVVHMWSISSGKRLGDINPKVEGSDFKICNSPDNKQDILLSVEVSVGGGPFIIPHLFVYSLHTLKYTNFYAILPVKLVPTNPSNYFGLLDSQHVVFLCDRQGCAIDIFVFDIKSSALLAKKSEEIFNKRDSCIVNGHLALCKALALEVVNLSNLETIWKIEFEVPMHTYSRVLSNIHCIDMLSFYHFIIVNTSESIEVWNLENRKKCFVLPRCARFIASACHEDLENGYSKLLPNYALTTSF